MTVMGHAVRTCPQYYALSAFFASVRCHLEDYRRGALGNILDLPASMLSYLRTLDTSEQSWQRDQEKAMLKAHHV